MKLLKYLGFFFSCLVCIQPGYSQNHFYKFEVTLDKSVLQTKANSRHSLKVQIKHNERTFLLPAQMRTTRTHPQSKNYDYGFLVKLSGKVQFIDALGIYLQNEPIGSSNRIGLRENKTHYIRGPSGRVIGLVKPPVHLNKRHSSLTRQLNRQTAQNQALFLTDFGAEGIQVFNRFDKDSTWVNSWLILKKTGEAKSSRTGQQLSHLKKYIAAYPDKTTADITNAIKQAGGYHSWRSRLSSKKFASRGAFNPRGANDPLYLWNCSEVVCNLEASARAGKRVRVLFTDTKVGIGTSLSMHISRLKKIGASPYRYIHCDNITEVLNIMKAHDYGDRFSIWAGKPKKRGVPEGHVIFGQLNSKGRLIIYEGQAQGWGVTGVDDFFSLYRRYDVISHQGKKWPKKRTKK
ncbi:hypothetical protein M23134_00847 [Microscilla marina ATCC 23134]|uniref:Uncharacterized protein n=1 Tax=Microscilla marina ATCC 23134 TaxID=313606 RepID=A1ZUK7_MICM2|nr:hypothetical protein M23134_00847 [Microscilla marina ATCC 23134]